MKQQATKGRSSAPNESWAGVNAGRYNNTHGLTFGGTDYQSALEDAPGLRGARGTKPMGGNGVGVEHNGTRNSDNNNFGAQPNLD